MIEQYAVIHMTTPDGAQGRLILEEPSVMGIGRFNRYLDQARQAVNERYGPQPEGEDAGGDAPMDERTNAAAFIVRWVDMMTCLVRFEVESDGAWCEAPFPYADPIAFCERLRYSVQKEIADAAGRLVGPLLGRPSLGEGDQKKEPSATTIWLTSLPKAS